MTALDAVLDRLSSARRVGSGFIARCPAHDDRQASLSVKGGAEGAVLIHCHAGCPTEHIASEIGLTMKDLFNEEALPAAN